MKFLIAGLGNMGPEYANTRHNIGFQIAEHFVASSSSDEAFFTPDRYADLATVKFKGRIFKVIKPSTYMNLSGKAVAYWLQKEKIPIENLLVITDDLSLPFGKVRMKKKGGAGGHNGLKNIIEVLGTEAYPRLRFGIGSTFNRGQQVDYVLGEWSKEELETLPKRIDLAVEMIKAFGTIGIERAMSQYNNK